MPVTHLSRQLRQNEALQTEGSFRLNCTSPETLWGETPNTEYILKPKRKEVWISVPAAMTFLLQTVYTTANGEVITKKNLKPKQLRIILFREENRGADRERGEIYFVPFDSI